MKPGVLFVLFFLIASTLVTGCAAEKRYEVLSFFFDGVPTPAEEKAAEEARLQGDKKKAGVAVVTRYVHGPYGARLCDGCHERSSNKLVLPVQELCFKCHEFNMSKKYIHGPVVAGGCLVCHDPHESRYRFLLKSEPEKFCLYCHQEKDILKNSVHQGVEEQCTSCHNAHMSDEKYLLK